MAGKPITLIPYDEALRRCQPGGGDTGYCLGCRANAPTLPFGGEDEVLCPSCAFRLAPAHPRLARALEARTFHHLPLNTDIPF